MKKAIAVVMILILIVGMLSIFNNVYATEETSVIDETTESKLVELKSNMANSLEDYQRKIWIRYLWISSIHIKLSKNL